MKEDTSGEVRIANSIQARVENGDIDSKGCGHVAAIQDVRPSADGCEDCLKIGGMWVRLRICLTCGHVGCCDQSVHKHAMRHYHGTNHPMMASYEEGESWLWCFVDEVVIEA
jgi:uncharacterized UBP type Zn finger protein